MHKTVEQNNLMHWLHQASSTMRAIASTVILAYLILLVQSDTLGNV